MRVFDDLDDEIAAMEVVGQAAPTMDGLMKVADTVSGGHLSILKFTTNYRIGFETPNSWGDIQQMAQGRTFEEAAYQALRQLSDRLYSGGGRHA
jgi:hypothetical protein